MEVKIKDLQNLVETSYQKTQQLTPEQEEIRRHLGFTGSAGKVAEGVYTYLVYPNDEARVSLQDALIAHIVSVFGVISYYDMDMEELLDRMAQLLYANLKEEPIEDPKDA